LSGHRLECVVFAIENPRRPAMRHALVAGDLDHASFRGEVALENHQPAGLFDWLRDRAHDFLPGGFACRIGLDADRSARHRHFVFVQQARFLQAFCD